MKTSFNVGLVDVESCTISKNKIVTTFFDHCMSQAQKQPTLCDFLTKMRTMAMHGSKSRSRNKNNNNKNMTHAKQKFNKILLQRRNKTRL
jgi:hypothetical protein